MTVKAEFYVQLVPVHKKDYMGLKDEIEELKAVAMTQKVPTEPKGIVVKFVYEADEETLMPVVKVKAEVDTQGTVLSLMQTAADLAK